TDFGILVQDRNTQEVELGATVDLTVVTGSDTSAPDSMARAVQSNENKLLQTAELDLPTEGNWRMYISVKRTSEGAGFVLPIHVAKQQGLIEHLNFWPYVALAVFGAILLVVYVRRHGAARSEIDRASISKGPLSA